MKTTLSFIVMTLFATTLSSAHAMNCPQKITVQATGFKSAWPVPANFQATFTAAKGYLCAYSSPSALLNLESSYGVNPTYTATLRVRAPNGSSYVIVVPVTEPTATTLSATGPAQFGTEEVSDIADGGTSYGMSDFRVQGTAIVKFKVSR
jgi:hypothetical protein